MIEVERILRVDHAGEFGAINIYRSQLFVARFLYKDIVPKLEEMLSHENSTLIPLIASLKSGILDTVMRCISGRLAEQL